MSVSDILLGSANGIKEFVVCASHFLEEFAVLVPGCHYGDPVLDFVVVESVNSGRIWFLWLRLGLILGNIYISIKRYWRLVFHVEYRGRCPFF